MQTRMATALVMLTLTACTHLPPVTYAPHAGTADVRQLPVQLCVDASMHPNLKVELMQAIYAWEDAIGSAYLQIACEVTESYPVDTPTPPPTGHIYVGYATEAFPPPVVGLTRLWAPSHGYVWIDPNLESDLRVNAFIHELGHVLGLGHIPGTVMAQNLPATLQYPGEYLGAAIQTAWVSGLHMDSLVYERYEDE